MATQRRQPNPKRPAAAKPAAGAGPNGNGPNGAGTTGPVAPAATGGAAPVAGVRPGSPKGPRRLGNQPAPSRGRPQSASAARRYERNHRSSSKRWGWLSVGLVVVVVAVLIVVKVGGGSPAKSPVTSLNGITSGQHPALASAALVSTVTNIPTSVYDSVGIAGQAPPFTVTKNQPALTSGGKPRFVYDGAEYCPYCAMMRWSLVMALGRFGTFQGLKETLSSPTDAAAQNVPTFSFIGTTYTSPYVTFTPYETLDRLQQPLQTEPADVRALYIKYDGSESTGAAAPVFNPGGSAGIPFLDIGNKYISAGDPGSFTAVLALLNNGGPGRTAIANAMANPSSSVGKSLGTALFVAQANYLSAAICAVDGAKPASVCASPGVKAAAAALAAVKPVG